MSGLESAQMVMARGPLPRACSSGCEQCYVSWGEPSLIGRPVGAREAGCRQGSTVGRNGLQEGSGFT
jgi:hypothetical protein